MQDAIARGLRYNLGLVESEHGSSDVCAERLRALSALLPQLSATATQAFEDISYREIGLKLPPIPGVPGTSADQRRVRISGCAGRLVAAVGRPGTTEARKHDEQASALSVKDSRDVVVLAVGTAYFQVVASAARVETASAQVASAQELDQLTANRVKNEVSPEIDSLRAQVERQYTEQRLTDAINQPEIYKLTFARITP